MAKRGEKPIPKGRVRRTAKVGRLAGGQVARSAATRAANVARPPDERQKAIERRQLKAAQQIVDVLGQMKGAAMKVGQVASFIDIGGLPPEVRDVFQAKLAELRDAAPQVAFKDMRKVIEADLDEPLDEAFAEFDEEAVAAASIGQVYRDRFGEIVFRFFFGSLWRIGFFSGDPHPGNYLLMDDGRVAFLDFGMTKKLSFAHLGAERELIGAGLDGDVERFHERVVRSGYYEPDDEVASPDRVMEHARAPPAW